MLQQNFMPAETLGITEEQHAALVKTLGFFERGEVPPEKFAMGVWRGTVCCIGGWAEKLGNCDMLVQMPNGLHQLFMGGGVGIQCRDPAKGAHALRNYLVSGDADWPSVMAAA